MEEQDVRLICVCLIAIVIGLTIVPTVLYFFRRLRRVMPEYSWLKIAWWNLLIVAVGIPLQFLWVVGTIVTAAVMIVFVRRMTGTGVGAAFLLSFALGAIQLLFIALLCRAFGVDPAPLIDSMRRPGW